MCVIFIVQLIIYCNIVPSYAAFTGNPGFLIYSQHKLWMNEQVQLNFWFHVNVILEQYEAAMPDRERRKPEVTD